MIIVLDSRRPSSRSVDVNLRLEAFLGMCDGRYDVREILKFALRFVGAADTGSSTRPWSPLSPTLGREESPLGAVIHRHPTTFPGIAKEPHRE